MTEREPIGAQAPGKASMLRRAEALAAAVPAAADLVILGDSLAAGWPPALWAEAAPEIAAFNFGLAGARVQHALWRLATTETGHLRPGACLLLLGTNNLADGDRPDRIAAGLAAVVAEIRRLWREPEVVVLAIPWRRECERVRETGRLRANAAVAVALAGRAILVDPDPVLGAGPTAVPGALAPDGLHLAATGYRLLTDALGPTILRCVERVRSRRLTPT